ncbi:class I SAM-dependent RNA methyltransferase [Candidatus Saccharibacteria bacterium]|nr:class I SAM-dependent RNA methyltransferase [Candidatus Saccharibacteria bacterium]
MKKTPQFETLVLEKIVGGGQALGTLENGRKAFVWGGLPGEKVTIRVTKKKSHFVEGIVTQVLQASPERTEPLDPESYLSTSPWQVMSFEAEQHYKAALIEEAFELHDIVLPDPIEVSTDGRVSHYRNKVEFSFFGFEDTESNYEYLKLAFFQRGGKGKIPVATCSLLPAPMMDLALDICAYLESVQVTARQLKTLLIRCDQQGNCVWQLYIKEEVCGFMSEHEAAGFKAQGGEVIYSDPRSPASRITKRLLSVGNVVLTDTILGVPFRYATEGFFQVNIPVYEQALSDMKQWIKSEAPIVDLYSGVGSIGLTIGGDACTLIEIDENAVREMKRNIKEQASGATAVHAASEKALDYITSEQVVIVDPPRAGMHQAVIDKLLETAPPRIIYLSCNPVTQARDVALLSEKYGIRAHRGYNFFPRTPHIEHLVILDKK